jgi:hypothetical protein
LAKKSKKRLKIAKKWLLEAFGGEKRVVNANYDREWEHFNAKGAHRRQGYGGQAKGRNRLARRGFNYATRACPPVAGNARKTAVFSRGDRKGRKVENREA